jgi:methylated-DNA-[protein]-cysteine S-methyltransferase
LCGPVVDPIVNDDDTGIYARPLDALDRAVQIGVAQGRVLSVSFPTQADAGADADHPLLDRLLAYFAGEPTDFDDLTVALTIPTDQRAVLETLRTVPYGDSVTVEALARMTPGLDPETEADRRTVRDALAGNPLPVVIPDHRVSDATGATPDAVAAAARTAEA